MSDPNTPFSDLRMRRAALADADDVVDLVDQAYRPYIARIGMFPGQ